MKFQMIAVVGSVLALTACSKGGGGGNPPPPPAAPDAAAQRTVTEKACTEEFVKSYETLRASLIAYQKATSAEKVKQGEVNQASVTLAKNCESMEAFKDTSCQMTVDGQLSTVDMKQYVATCEGAQKAAEEVEAGKKPTGEIQLPPPPVQVTAPPQAVQPAGPQSPQTPQAPAPQAPQTSNDDDSEPAAGKPVPAPAPQATNSDDSPTSSQTQSGSQVIRWGADEPQSQIPASQGTIRRDNGPARSTVARPPAPAPRPAARAERSLQSLGFLRLSLRVLDTRSLSYLSVDTGHDRNNLFIANGQIIRREQIIALADSGKSVPVFCAFGDSRRAIPTMRPGDVAPATSLFSGTSVIGHKSTRNIVLALEPGGMVLTCDRVGTRDLTASDVRQALGGVAQLIVEN